MSQNDKLKFIKSIKENFKGDYQYEEHMSEGEKEVSAALLTVAYLLCQNDHPQAIEKQWDYSIPPDTHINPKDISQSIEEKTDSSTRSQQKKKPKYHPHVSTLETGSDIEPEP